MCSQLHMSAPSLPGWLILIYLSTDQELDVLCSQLQMSGPSLPNWLILVSYPSTDQKTKDITATG